MKCSKGVRIPRSPLNPELMKKMERERKKSKKRKEERRKKKDEKEVMGVP